MNRIDCIRAHVKTVPHNAEVLDPAQASVHALQVHQQSAEQL